MFRSLWSRLFISHALVAILALLAAAASLAYLLQGYERQLTLTRLADIAVPLYLNVRNLHDLGVPARDLVTNLQSQAEELGVRILLVNEQGTVIQDTSPQGTLVGERMALPHEKLSADRSQMYTGQFRASGNQSFLFVALPILDRQRTAPVMNTTLVVAQPDRPVGAALAELSQQLQLAGLIALGAALLFALALSRSLARPLSRLTHASTEMARGRYEQKVPVEGPDEIRRLATSFNRMAAEVARSRRVLREFVANVSHELRTPLTAINGFVVALQDGTITESDQQRQALATISGETRRLHRLVAQLLDLSRIESGQIPLAWGAVDLAQVLNDSLEIFASRADEASLQLRGDVPATLPIEGDADRLEQVFNNLIDNAIKNTPAGGLITVRARQDANLAVVDIADSGTGIPAEDLDRVFERFYQVSKSRSGVGSGLGLSIVREIVRAHGGSISLESEVGAGSTFSVALPLKQAA